MTPFPRQKCGRREIVNSPGKSRLVTTACRQAAAKCFLETMLSTIADRPLIFAGHTLLRYDVVGQILFSIR